MPKNIATRREDPRYPIPSVLGARIEFTGPDGIRYDWPLTEVSVRGAGFGTARKIAGVKRGAMLADAVIRVADIEIRGNLEVRHATRGFGSKHNCGVKFFPLSEADRNELIALVTRLKDLPST